jgi:hypothetical protein
VTYVYVYVYFFYLIIDFPVTTSVILDDRAGGIHCSDTPTLDDIVPILDG